jgi:hypothetical protein
MHGIIPLKAILFNRHIGTSRLCPLCNSYNEDVLHMIFKCKGAANIWKAMGLENIIESFCQADHLGSEVLKDILCSRPTIVLSFSSWCRNWWPRVHGTFGGFDVGDPMVKISRLLCAMLLPSERLLRMLLDHRPLQTTRRKKYGKNQEQISSN